MNDPGCEPVFIISVAARLLEMHPQTLRKYEREGLIAPSRTTGNLRLYSDEDLDRLRQVKFLVNERGLNLAGVQLILELTRHNWQPGSIPSHTVVQKVVSGLLIRVLGTTHTTSDEYFPMSVGDIRLSTFSVLTHGMLQWSGGNS